MKCALTSVPFWMSIPFTPRLARSRLETVPFAICAPVISDFAVAVPAHARTPMAAMIAAVLRVIVMVMTSLLGMG